MKFEITTKQLKKGDIIPVKEIERITQSTFGTTKYAFGLLSLGQFIENAMAEEGLNVTTAIRKGSLHILTDRDAQAYLTNRFESGLTCMEKSNRKHAQINIENLDEQEKEVYKHNQIVQSRVLQAIKKEQRLLN